jgi:GT2 family glycosyltransferase
LPEEVAGAEPLVGVVVVNWRDRDRTKRCLRALSALTYPHWRLFLVDNQGPDLSAAEVASIAPGAEYLSSAENLGFAGGSNLGMRAALGAGAGYVWFLNNDTEPDPDSLSELIAAAGDDPSTALVGAKILRLGEPQRIDSLALHVSLWSGRVFLVGHDEVDRGQYDQWRDPQVITACALLASRAVCERLEGFDERFFAYLEDADFCLRARASGFRVLLAARARVYHDRPASTSDRQSPASIYYTARNHLFLMDRHGTGGEALRALRRIFIVALNTAYCARLRSPGARDRLRALCQGVRDYRRGVMGGPWPAAR